MHAFWQILHLSVCRHRMMQLGNVFIFLVAIILSLIQTVETPICNATTNSLTSL